MLCNGITVSGPACPRKHYRTLIYVHLYSWVSEQCVHTHDQQKYCQLWGKTSKIVAGKHQKKILGQTMFSLTEECYPLDLYMLTDIGKTVYVISCYLLFNAQCFICKSQEEERLSQVFWKLHVYLRHSVRCFIPEAQITKPPRSIVKLKKKANSVRAQQYSPALCSAPNTQDAVHHYLKFNLLN